MWFWEKKNEFTEEQLYRERGWEMDDILDRMVANKLDIRYMDDGRCIYIESERETRKYGGVGRGTVEPEKKTVVLYEKPGHGRIFMTVPVEQPKPKSGFWGVVELICFLIMLPFTILGMRDGVQWFLGTGEYGGDDMD